MNEKDLLLWLKNYQGRPLRIMEVCGTHTSALYKTGLRQILPKNIQLLSGPGCPVCVTPAAYIDKLVEYAFKAGHMVLTFGDMLAVPGSKISLAQAKARGGRVDFFYTPEDALERARLQQEITFIVAAVGFETTTPIWATLVKQAAEENLTNIKFLTALKTMPKAISSLCERGDIDGFLCPGHVAVITGTQEFAALAKVYEKAMVVGGFERQQLVKALVRLILETSRKHTGLWNEYSNVVREHGNPLALSLIAEIFEAGKATWRGLGVLESSGVYLKSKYSFWDAGSYGLDYDRMPKGCQCGQVLLGKIEPRQCPCFGRSCTPEHPVGACMVSSEGSCCINYREGDIDED